MNRYKYLYASSVARVSNSQQIGLDLLDYWLDWIVRPFIVEEERGQRKAGKWDKRMTLRYFQSVLCEI